MNIDMVQHVLSGWELSLRAYYFIGLLFIGLLFLAFTAVVWFQDFRVWLPIKVFISRTLMGVASLPEFLLAPEFL